MRTLIFSLVVLSSFLGMSQSVDSAEYFFDADSGVGNGNPLSVSANSGELNQTYMIDVSSLSNGFHSLYIRTFNNGNNWSHYDRSTFYISEIVNAQNIVAAEYSYDSDNGVGSGIPLTVDPQSPNISQSFMIPTTGLDEGFHSPYIRTQIADGTWSLYDRQIIFISDFDYPPSPVTDAEYFIDIDPGIGLGEPLAIAGTPQTFNFNATGLPEGDHLFCIRVRNLDGSWSLYDCEIFNIDNALGLSNSLFDVAKVSPNPVIDVLNIELSQNMELIEVSIIDLKGKTIVQKFTDLENINLKGLASGLYLLRLKTEKETASFKIIKE